MTSRTQKISSISGVLLLNFLARSSLYWGNLSVYLMSYFVRGLDDDANADLVINTVWYGVLYGLGWTFSIQCSEVVARYIHPKCIILAGILVFNTFFFGSVLCLENNNISWTAYVLTFSFIAGTGLGMFETQLIKHYVLEWADESERGTLTCLTLASFSAGMAFVNQFITWWINPRNLKPDLLLGSFVVFSQDEILDRIPQALLVLGCISTGSQLLGFCLLRDRKSVSTNTDSAPVSLVKTSYESLEMESRKTELETNHVTREMDDTCEDQQEMNSSVTTSTEKEYSFAEFICCRDFQRLFFIYYALVQTYIVASTCYKEFGLVWIKNDHLFSYLGTVMALSSIVSQVVTGMCVDKFGLKISFMASSAALTILNILMYVLAMVDQVAYSIITVAVFSISIGSYACTMAATVIVFGPKYLGRNIALISVASFLGAATASVVIELLVNTYGWFFVFVWMSGFSFVAFIFITVDFPERIKKDSK